MKSNLNLFAVVFMLMISAFSYAQDAGVPNGTYKSTQIASTGKPHIISMTVTNVDGLSNIVYSETIDGVELCNAKLVYVSTVSKDHYLYKSSVAGTKDCTNGSEMYFTIMDPSAANVNLQRGTGRVFSFIKQ